MILLLILPTSQHAVYDRTVFTFYKTLNLFQDIKSYVGSLKAIRVGQILLSCNVKGKLTKIGFTKVLHVPDASINLIFFGQLDGVCPMHLILNRILVGTEKIVAQKRQNNLYTFLL